MSSSKPGQQNLSAFHHPVVQYPSLKSNNHCSLRTIMKATTADRNPTMVTMIHPTLLSILLRSLPRKDSRLRRRNRRTESLIASCNQSTEEYEEYQTRIPFDLTSGPAPGSSPLGFTSEASYADIGLWPPKYDLRNVEAVGDISGLDGPVVMPGMRTPIEGKRRIDLKVERVGEAVTECGREP